MKRVPVNTLVTLLAWGCVLVASVATASAAAWIPGLSIGTPGEPQCSEGAGCSGDIAVAPDGTALASWAEFGGPEGRTYVGLRKPGESWDTVNLSALAQQAGLAIDGFASLSLAPNGDASATVGDQTGGQIEAYRSASSAWKFRSLPDDRCRFSGGPGNIYLCTWREAVRPGVWSARASTRKGLNGQWSAPADLSNPPGAALASRAVESIAQTIDGRGQASVAFVHDTPDGDGVWVRRAAESGAWGAAQRIDRDAAGLRAELIDIASSPNGHLAIAWWESTDAVNETLNVAFSAPGSANWTTRPVVTRRNGVWGDENIRNLRVVGLDIGEDGRAVVAFNDVSPLQPQVDRSALPTTRVLVAEGDAAGPWAFSPLTSNLAENELVNMALTMEVHVDRLGGAFVGFMVADGYGGWVDWNTAASYRPPGGLWTAVRPGGLGLGFDADSDDQGNHVVNVGDGLVSVLDQAGPRLTITAPKTLQAGAETVMSVRSVDTWSSPVGAPRWLFGDGQSATGAAVRHRFTTPGAYSVTVIQDDSAGNRSLATATIAVTGAAPGVPVSLQSPRITGDVRVGGVVGCEPGTWRDADAFSWRWLVDGQPIGGASGATFAPRSADLGAALVCEVTATNETGASLAQSQAVEVKPVEASPGGEPPPGAGGPGPQAPPQAPPAAAASVPTPSGAVATPPAKAKPDPCAALTGSARARCRALKRAAAAKAACSRLKGGARAKCLDRARVAAATARCIGLKGPKLRACRARINPPRAGR